MSPESPPANLLKFVCYTATIFTTELMARWLTLIGVLLSLVGGERQEGGMICLVMEACKDMLHRLLGQGWLSCELL
jgi:hypothetical protein